MATHLPADTFGFMTPDKLASFERDVTQYITKEHPDFMIDFPNGAVNGPDSTEYGMSNLAQTYLSSFRWFRKKTIADHFKRIYKSKLEEKEFYANVKDFDKVKSKITVRIWGADVVGQMKGMLISREDVPGTRTLLTFDLPSTVMNIRPDDAKVWGISKKELFALGVKNSLAMSTAKVSQAKLTDELKVSTIEGESVYTANSVLDFERYQMVLGKYGSLVIIPNRHILAVYPIEDIDVVKAVNALPFLAKVLYDRGPGSITTNMYLYKDKKFLNLPYKIEDKKFNFYPPDKFIQLLNVIAGKKK